MKFIISTIFSIVVALAPVVAGAEENSPDAKPVINQFIKSQAKSIGGEEVLTRQTSDPFDFDGLRKTDIAVLYWIGQGNDATAYLAVFEKSGTSWNLTHHVRLGGRGLRSITKAEFSERLIRLNSLEFSGGEPLGSPSLRVTIDLTTKYGLLNVSRQEHKED